MNIRPITKYHSSGFGATRPANDSGLVEISPDIPPYPSSFSARLSSKPDRTLFGNRSNNFWQGKRVVVTGGAGFIGSHVVEELVRRGAVVTVPIREKDRSTEFLSAVKNEVTVCVADLSDLDQAMNVFSGQEIVLHLAAKVSGIEFNINHPSIVFRENMLLGMNVLEAAREAGVERMLMTSTACVYPRFATIPTPETEGFRESPEPTNEGYGWSKRMGEYLATAYAKEYGMKIAIARPYNAYGPRDNFDPKWSHVIPALIRRITEGENPLQVWGNGLQSRGFVYVTDVAQGLLSATEEYAVADPVNIGGDEEVTVRKLVELLVRLSGKDIKIEFDPTKPVGQPRRACDTTKMKSVLSFRPEVTLEDGLRQTIEWYTS